MIRSAASDVSQMTPIQLENSRGRLELGDGEALEPVVHSTHGRLKVPVE